MGSCVCVGRQLLWLLQLAGYKLQAMEPRLSCGESFLPFFFCFNFIGKSIRWLQIVFGCWSALNLFDFIGRPAGFLLNECQNFLIIFILYI